MYTYTNINDMDDPVDIHTYVRTDRHTHSLDDPQTYTHTYTDINNLGDPTDRQTRQRVGQLAPEVHLGDPMAKTVSAVVSRLLGLGSFLTECFILPSYIWTNSRKTTTFAIFYTEEFKSLNNTHTHTCRHTS